MGININVPKTIQQNTPLRGVRSGATAEPDNNVKYVPQDLTEAQQAQARENIGAAAEGGGGTQVQANWNETDTESPAYIQNKPAESLELTMTDEDGNVITGTFVLSSKTITPAV